MKPRGHKPGNAPPVARKHDASTCPICKEWTPAMLDRLAFEVFGATRGSGK